jgi:GntR family transcriptional repressor for pyruvate dehydrogenase complex
LTGETKVLGLFRRIQHAPKLSSDLADALILQIKAGGLEPGQRLPTEHTIVRETGVSRTVVREALATLRAQGLIVTRQGLGAFVAPTPMATVTAAQVRELRAVLEPEAAALAALRRTTDELHQLELALVSGASDPVEDEAFHRLILRATHNPCFTDAIPNFGIQSTDDAVARAQSHRQILAAITMSDAAAARRAMQDHLHAELARSLKLSSRDEPEHL